MKYIILLLFLSSCKSRLFDTETKPKESKIVYIKDTRTGLCFASTVSISYASRTVISISCVPCDSLRNVEVEDIENK